MLFHAVSALFQCVSLTVSAPFHGRSALDEWGDFGE
jgi:hypothetical protein